MESKHNSSYWANEHYVGLGPGAHSFNGVKRSWNVSSNTAYIQQIDKNVLPSESEVLTSEEKFNEYLLTALRTRKGLSFTELNNRCDSTKIDEIKAVLQEKAAQGLVTIHNDGVVLTTKGLLFADAIASSLFIVP
jgi:oxygen-independent coproporphyrinogen-3 oxidase